jgi:hypothetical protein
MVNIVSGSPTGAAGAPICDPISVPIEALRVLAKLTLSPGNTPVPPFACDIGVAPGFRTYPTESAMVCWHATAIAGAATSIAKATMLFRRQGVHVSSFVRRPVGPNPWSVVALAQGSPQDARCGAPCWMPLEGPPGRW